MAISTVNCVTKVAIRWDTPVQAGKRFVFGLGVRDRPVLEIIHANCFKEVSIIENRIELIAEMGKTTKYLATVRA